MKNEDRFFEAIARQYMDEEGEDLKELSEKLNKEAMDTSTLDKKIKGSIKKDKQKKYYMASGLVACAILIVLVTNIYFMNQRNLSGSYAEDSTRNSEKDIAMLSNKLPLGFKVTGIDYDKEKTIFYVLGNENNDIVVEEESSEDILKTDGLKEIYISNVKAYGISKADYSLITFKLNDKLYTLTSPYAYDAKDLIFIGESIIRSS